MNKSNDGKKALIIVMIVVGLFMTMSISFIFLADGAPMFIIMPVLMFAIMFGLFAFFIKASVKNNQQGNNTFTELDERHCIHCHQSIETYNKFCPLCGVEQTDYIICDYCGHKNKKELLQCEKCNALIK